MDVEDTPEIVLKFTKFVTVVITSFRSFMDRMELGSFDLLRKAISFLQHQQSKNSQFKRLVPYRCKRSCFCYGGMYLLSVQRDLYKWTRAES